MARRGVGRLKHLQVRQLWLQDQRDGRLTVERVGTLGNPADLFTKIFAAPRHCVLTDMMDLSSMDEADNRPTR
eukprot:784980-Heterocapsa_arctica.AAC.1